jgi:hypothetical protein
MPLPRVTMHSRVSAVICSATISPPAFRTHSAMRRSPASEHSPSKELCERDLKTARAWFRTVRRSKLEPLKKLALAFEDLFGIRIPPLGTIDPILDQATKRCSNHI